MLNIELLKYKQWYLKPSAAELFWKSSSLKLFAEERVKYRSCGVKVNGAEDILWKEKNVAWVSNVLKVFFFLKKCEEENLTFI